MSTVVFSGHSGWCGVFIDGAITDVAVIFGFDFGDGIFAAKTSLPSFLPACLHLVFFR